MDFPPETSNPALSPAPIGSTVLHHQKLPASAAPHLTGCVILLIEPKLFLALTYDFHPNLLSLSPCTVGK